MESNLQVKRRLCKEIEAKNETIIQQKIDLNAEQATNIGLQEQIAKLKSKVKELDVKNLQLKIDREQCIEDLVRKQQEIDQQKELCGQLREIQRQNHCNLDESVEVGDQSFSGQNNSDCSGE